ncbi:hypothetical protein [uncultured Algibacter sp.]|uniref:hypothetical protein n=1 Tax=uncultured Algibacter sp. TaxID=298659 RepID=UPI002616D6BA|nr:hypothetical protein [uncultured Algibacter sp.]
MKTIKTLALFLFVLTFSCSESNDSEDVKQQEQGSISIAFTDFGGFVMENIVATISNNYEATNNISINVKADAEGASGKLTLTIVDNSDIEAFKTGEEYAFSDNTAPIYVTASFVNINRDFTGSTGKLRITKFEENVNGNSKLIKISGTFNVTGTGFTTMLSTINDLILTCNSCGS